MVPPLFAGLDYLTAAILVTDPECRIMYANPAAQTMFALRDDAAFTLAACFGPASPLVQAVLTAENEQATITEHELLIETAHGEMFVSLTASPLDLPGTSVIVECRQIDSQRRIANEERVQAQQQANRELIRNLAHEIKNPLGGIHGAAQLLAHELPEPRLREYTQVIVEESQRLQGLLDRLLTPHRLPKLTELNIHEVLERVRSLMLAEVPNGLAVKRDYDLSLPTLIGDREQLIQSVLNITRNAVQAMSGVGVVLFRTRISRQVTLNRKRFPLAIRIEIIDNGPGIPESLRDTLFYPLVSGRPGGIGIGLHLAHTFVVQHQGTIEFESRPGQTSFTILLPLNAWKNDKTEQA
jgi:two-component system nitrogen regulation sensor histidine kinase GlnL